MIQKERKDQSRTGIGFISQKSPNGKNLLGHLYFVQLLCCNGIPPTSSGCFELVYSQIQGEARLMKNSNGL
jgi:hypothetical protein